MASCRSRRGIFASATRDAWATRLRGGCGPAFARGARDAAGRQCRRSSRRDMADVNEVITAIARRRLSRSEAFRPAARRFPRTRRRTRASSQRCIRIEDHAARRGHPAHGGVLSRSAKQETPREEPRASRSTRPMPVIVVASRNHRRLTMKPALAQSAKSSREPSPASIATRLMILAPSGPGTSNRHASDSTRMTGLAAASLPSDEHFEDDASGTSRGSSC